MLSKILKRFRMAEERGFTLIEVAAGVVIMSVVGMALLNFYGNGTNMISRQVNDMDTRNSARAVLTRMVKDIQLAPQIALSTDGTIVDIQDDHGTTIEKYVFDQTQQEIYAEKDGQKTFLIHAIQAQTFANPSQMKNELEITITIQVGTSILKLSDTATARLVNYNNSKVPVIFSVTSGVVDIASGSSQEDAEGNGDRDDDAEKPATPFTQIVVAGTNTHFTTNDTVVVLVPHGSALDLKNLNASGNVVFQNDGQNVVTVKTPTKLDFNLPYDDFSGVSLPAYYDVYAITPNSDLDGTVGNGQSEVALMVNGLKITNQPLNGHEKDDEESGYAQPDDNTQWDQGQTDWLVSGGSSFNSFGSIDDSDHIITKKSNCNNKIAYYDHAYATFDYKATINITDGAIDNQATVNPDDIAMLTLWYNGDDNTTGGGGNYVGVGIDKDYLYVGYKGSMQRVPNYTLPTQGQATIEAKSDFDSNKNEYRLQIFVDGDSNPVYTSYEIVPWGSGYLGVTVNNPKTNATFSVTP